MWGRTEKPWCVNYRLAPQGLCLWPGPLGFNFWISFAPIFSYLYCWVLIFVLSPFYIPICLSLFYLLYISQFLCSRRLYINKFGIFGTKHFFVLIHIWNKGEVGTIKHVVIPDLCLLPYLVEWWQMLIARDRFFYSILMRIMDSFSWLLLYTTFSYL